MNSRGEARAAIVRDVTGSAGVALTEVGRAFSDPAKRSPDTHRRMGSAGIELGDTANPEARSRDRRSRGRLLVLLSEIGNPFFSVMLKGIEGAARERGRALLPGTAREPRWRAACPRP